MLKLDRVAQLRAELDSGQSEAELLERERLDANTWRESCAHWDAKLAEEAAEGRSVLASRYNTAFNTKRRLLAPKSKRAEPSPEHALGGTTIGVDAGAVLRKILPFRQGEFPNDARVSAWPPRAAPLPVDPSGTVEIDPNSAELGAALPFLAELRAKHQQATTATARARLVARRFTLEQFAALTAQIATAPDDAPRIRARWQLDEASHRAESEAWQQACALDSALLSRFAELVRRYRAAYAASAG